MCGENILGMLTSNSYPAFVTGVLKYLDCANAPLLGQGGEGFVFAYNNIQAVKIYRDTSSKNLEALAGFQTLLSTYSLLLDEALQRARQTIITRLQAAGIPVESRYVRQSAHITLMRYILPLQTPIETWLHVLQNVPSQQSLRWNIDTISTLWGRTWYGMYNTTQQIGPYQLELAPSDIF